MPQSQAEALSKVLADIEARLATKEDVSNRRAELVAMKADLTWRMIAVVGLLGTVITLLNVFVA